MEIKTFIPGSEWVYFKLYTGTKTADSILKIKLYEFIREMLKNDVIDKWFFIRYSDPDFHIRLRLHLNESRNFNYTFNSFFTFSLPLINDRLIWNIQCDTYKREMERYGDNTIAIVEDIFFIDSEYIIRLLNHLTEENPEQHRWKQALTLIDSFLSAFLFELPQRKLLLNTLAEKLIAMDKCNKMQVPLTSLLTSMIHMTMNRWFRTKNRLYEMVICEFLARYYTSEIAKVKRK